MGHGRLVLAVVAAWLAMSATAAADPFTLYSNGIPAGSRPDEIAAGSDGALWFTERFGGAIGRITTTGTVTQFSAGLSGDPVQIAAGPDGALWFNETGPGSDEWRLGRITTAGAVTEWSLPAGENVGNFAILDGALYATRCHQSPFFACAVVRVLAD